MSETPEIKEIKPFDYVTVNGKVPAPAITFNEKRLKRISYVVSVIVGLIVYFVVFRGL